MESDLARMMADLGVDRRDQLSAPDETGRGRGDESAPREQCEIQREVKARRMRALEEPKTGAGGDERASNLAAWNRESTFDRDEVTEKLENRASGQGHRAEMRRRIGSNGYVDDNRMSGRFNDNSIVERGNRTPHSRSGPMPSRDSGAERFRRMLSSHTSPPKIAGDLRRNTMIREHNRERAPDPRLSGTTRFSPGGERTTYTPDQLRNMRSALSQAATTTSRAATPAATPPASKSNITTNTLSTARLSPENVEPVPASMMQSIHAPAQTVAARPVSRHSRPSIILPAPHPATRIAGTISTAPGGERSVLTPGGPRSMKEPTRDVGREGAAAVRARAAANDSMPGFSLNTKPVPSFPSLQSSRPMTSVLVSVEPAQATPAQIQSTPSSSSTRPSASTPLPAHSPNPGPARTTSTARTPSTATSSVSIADMQRFKMKALAWAARPGPDCRRYYEENEDQQEFFKEARDFIMKEIVGFVKSGNVRARQVYTETHHDRLWMVEDMEVVKEQIESGAGEEEIRGYLGGPHEVHSLFLRVGRSHFAPRRCEDMPPVSSTPTVVQPEATVQLAEVAVQAETSSKPQDEEAAAHQGENVDKGQDIGDQSDEDIGDLEKSLRDLNKAMDQMQKAMGQANAADAAAPPSPPAPPSLMSASSDTSAEASEPDSDSPHSKRGTLTVYFKDAAGKFVGVHQAELSVPVEINMNLNSTSQGYDPRKLIATVTRFAASFGRLSTPNSPSLTRSSKRSRKLTQAQTIGNAESGEDGVWREIGEAEEPLMGDVTPAILEGDLFDEEL